MKRSFLLTAALLSPLSVVALAQTSAPSGQAAAAGETPNVAVIAFQSAVSQTNEFQRNLIDLQKKYEPKRQELKTLSDQVEALQKDLQAQGETLNEAQRESRAKTIDDKQKQLQRIGEDDQNDFQQDMQQTFNGVASKVGELLIAYAQQHGFTLVLNGGDQQAQDVLYANPATDITQAIVDAYNVKSGVPAPAPQPASAAPRPAAHAPAPRTPAQH